MAALDPEVVRIEGVPRSGIQQPVLEGVALEEQVVVGLDLRETTPEVGLDARLGVLLGEGPELSRHEHTKLGTKVFTVDHKDSGMATEGGRHSSEDGDPPVVESTITLTHKESGWWVAKDEETGVASQGETREEALENLDEAVALHKGEIGEDVADEEAVLRELGIDPEEVKKARAENDELPEFMQ